MEKRKLFSRKEWPLFALLILGLLAGALALYAQPRGVSAVVEVDGQAVAQRGLAGLAGQEELAVSGENGIEWIVEFSPDGARVISANCPDKTCQRVGQLTRAGESAVCLPGRMVLRLEGGEASADAQTY